MWHDATKDDPREERAWPNDGPRMLEFDVRVEAENKQPKSASDSLIGLAFWVMKNPKIETKLINFLLPFLAADAVLLFYQHPK